MLIMFKDMDLEFLLSEAAVSMIDVRCVVLLYTHTHTQIERCKDWFIFTPNIDFYEAVWLHFPVASLCCEQFSLRK